MRSRKGEQKREQLRKAAYLCFRDDGYHETTVDAICQRAGSSKGSFYWHYSSKQEVFIDILDAWSRQVMDELYEQFEASLMQDDYVSAIQESLINEIHRGRVIIALWLEFTLQTRTDGEMQQALAKFYRRARLALAEILRPMLKDELSDYELRGLAATLFGAYTGLLIQDMSDPSDADAIEMVKTTMAVVGHLFSHLSAGNNALKQSQRITSTHKEVEETTPTIGDRVSENEIDDLVGSFIHVNPLLKTLRTIIYQTIPSANERIISGWKQIAYDSNGLFCYLKPRKDGVRFGFQNGASLDDSNHLLKGKGKKQRYVDFTPRGHNSSSISPGIAAPILRQRIAQSLLNTGDSLKDEGKIFPGLGLAFIFMCCYSPDFANQN